MNDTMQIAHTIRQQITLPDPRLPMSWGATKFIALKSNGVDVLGGLMFSVNGRKFRGQVRVLLVADDTYRLQLVRMKKLTPVVVSSFDGIYCDELAGVIDSAVET